MLKIVISLLLTQIYLLADEEDLVFTFYLDNWYVFFSAILLFLAAVWGIEKAISIVRFHNA